MFLFYLIAAWGMYLLGRKLRRFYVSSRMPSDEQMLMLVEEARGLQEKGTPEKELRRHLNAKGFPREIDDIILSKIGLESPLMSKADWWVVMISIGGLAAFLYILFLA